MTLVKTNFESEYVVKVHDAKLGMTGVLVIHNTVLGPGKGGIRMTANVTEEEVLRLATTMTWKNAIAGIPFGGAKAGLVIPHGTTREVKKQMVQSFARALKPFLVSKYIAGPDVNSGEEEMQWFVEAADDWNAATGKPANYCVAHEGSEKCGLPHELGSTGYGVAQAAAIAARIAGIDIKGATVAIHGFGNVGTFAYKFLTEMGAKVVAIADHTGAAYSESGFDSIKIQEIVEKKHHVADGLKDETIKAEDFWGLKVDILIPASVTDVINDSNKNDIKAKIIVEGGNIVMRENIEKELFERGIMIVPDFVANAGGVISSYAEYAGYNPKKMFKMVKDKITAATENVLLTSVKKKINPREVAMNQAVEIVEKAMDKRRATF